MILLRPRGQLRGKENVTSTVLALSQPVPVFPPPPRLSYAPCNFPTFCALRDPPKSFYFPSANPAHLLSALPAPPAPRATDLYIWRDRIPSKEDASMSDILDPTRPPGTATPPVHLVRVDWCRFVDSFSSSRRFGVVETGSLLGRNRVISGSFEGRFGVISGSFWGRFGVIWGSFWGRFRVGFYKPLNPQNYVAEQLTFPHPRKTTLFDLPHAYQNPNATTRPRHHPSNRPPSRLSSPSVEPYPSPPDLAPGRDRPPCLSHAMPFGYRIGP